MAILENQIGAPLAVAGAKTIVVGDSITRQLAGAYTSSDGISFSLEGTGFNWVQAMLGYPFTHNIQKNYGDNNEVTGKLGYNKGIGGDKAADVRARLQADVLALNPALVFFLVGTNDIKANTPLNDIITDWKYCVDQILAINASLVVYTVMPRSTDLDWDDNAERLVLFEFNNFIRTHVATLQAEGKKIALSDPWDNMRNWFGDGYTAATTTFKDGVHPNVRGGYFSALATLPIFQGLKNLDRHYKSVLTDIWNATTNPYGNIAPNPDLSGTGGTVSDGTGTIADDWRVQHFAGSNSVGAVSMVDAPNGGDGKAIKLTITSDGNGTDNERWLVYQSSYTTGDAEGVIDGNTYRAQARVWVTNITGELWKQTHLQFFDADGDRDVWAGLGNNSDVPLPADDYDRLLITPQTTLDASADRVRLEFDTYLDGTVAGSFDVYIWHPDFRYLEAVPPLV